MEIEGNSPAAEAKPSFQSIFRKGQYRHAYYSGVATLTLGIMGGAVLPVAYAFSTTGIVCGFLIMAVVASANTYTCDLLLKQSYHTGAIDYESLAFQIGGKWWKLATEISIVVLLIGSAIGGIQQVSEAGVSALHRLSSNVPHWLTGNGRILTLLFVVVVVAPLCLVEKIRQLEAAATIGTSIVIWLVVVIVVDAIRYDLPAVKNGQLAATGFSGLGLITQAVSIFGFAFYIQPFMMPFIAEMPAGLVGIKLISYSIRTVILGTAFFIYSAAGFFGAARYGKSTAENILENNWLGGRVAQGVLNLAMAFYLSIAIPILEFPTRHTINDWIPGRKDHKPFRRHLCITAGILVFCTGISLIWPNKSAQIVTITGATGVCMVSYLIPVVNHLILFFHKAKCQTKQEIEEGEAKFDNKALNYRKSKIKANSTWSVLQEYAVHVGIPLIVVAVGVFCSVAALTTL